MGLFDFKDRAGKGPDAKVRGQEPTPEKRIFGNWLAQVPSAYRDGVKSTAENNHAYFTKRFPELNDFIDVVAEAWVKRRDTFNESASAAGFVPITGMSPEALNASIIICLTERGSWVTVGPGAFKRDELGASFTYKKVPFRVDPAAPPDVEAPIGFAFGKTPHIGHRLIPATGSVAPFDYRGTSPVISAYMLPSPREGAFENMKAINAGLVRKLEQVNAEVGLALVRPKT